MADVADRRAKRRRIGGRGVVDGNRYVDEPHAVSPANSAGRSAESVCAVHPIAQYAEPLDLKLDDVAMFQIAVQLQAAAIAHCARAEELARMDRFVARDIGDQFLEGEEHIGGGAARPGFAVDPDGHGELVGIGDLIGGNEPGPQNVSAIEAFALRRAHQAFHLGMLRVPGGEVVVDV